MGVSRHSASRSKPQHYTEASNQLHVAAASPQGSSLWYAVFKGLCRPQSRPGRIGGNEISCACRESNHDSSVMQPAVWSQHRLRYSDSSHSYRRCGKSVIEKNVPQFMSIQFTKSFYAFHVASTLVTT